MSLLRSATAPVLIETLEGGDRAALARIIPAVLAALRPATVAEIALELEGLSLHYHALRRTEGEDRLWVRQWAADLADHPRDLVAEACRLWRNSPEERFPTPGRLKALVRPLLLHRRALARRAHAVGLALGLDLGLDLGPPPEPHA